MDTFEEVKVVKKANVYYEGKVTSRTLYFKDGSKKTLGIILPGQYEFGTEEKELMEVLAGKISVLLPGAKDWLSYEAGQDFTVPAKSKFKVSVDSIADYCCSYIKE